MKENYVMIINPFIFLQISST